MAIRSALHPLHTWCSPTETDLVRYAAPTLAPTAIIRRKWGLRRRVGPPAVSPVLCSAGADFEPAAEARREHIDGYVIERFHSSRT